MPRREGSPTIVPYLIVDDVEAVIAFATEVLGAQERERETTDDGARVRHVELTLRDAVLMAGKTSERFAAMPGCLYVYVDTPAEVDALFAKAVAWGAEPVIEPVDRPYGQRNGGVRDAQGNQWWFGAELPR
ncbi:MAG: VOC family protein [Planctomycetota bacterium]